MQCGQRRPAVAANDGVQCRHQQHLRRGGRAWTRHTLLLESARDAKGAAPPPTVAASNLLSFKLADPPSPPTLSACRSAGLQLAEMRMTALSLSLPFEVHMGTLLKCIRAMLR
ncbi:hypothetical protein VPH35_036841 [Triticum aestivum]